MTKNKKEKIFYVDMDGVLVNFDLGSQKILNINPGPYELYKKENNINDPERKKILNDFWENYWSLVAHTPSFWLNLPPMDYIDKLIAELETHDSPAFILTAAPGRFQDKSLFDDVYQQKRQWIKKYLGKKYEKNFLCTYSWKKQEYIKNNPKHLNVLIDDRLDNIERWHSHGGHGIHHQEINDTISKIKNLKNYNLSKIKKK